MPVTYDTFTDKYKQFSSLDELRFNSFLADALLEIELLQWGTLKDKATEMLLGHLLSVADSEDKSATPLESFRTDDKGYEVRYREASDDWDTTIFGKEYKRLRDLILEQTPNAVSNKYSGTAFHAVRGAKKTLRF